MKTIKTNQKNTYIKMNTSTEFFSMPLCLLNFFNPTLVREIRIIGITATTKIVVPAIWNSSPDMVTTLIMFRNGLNI